jgi:AbrB family looped-hinge helix DNA binding protein
MPSKGQVVIPEDIRKRLKLKNGSQFVVVGNMKEFDPLISEARSRTSRPV